MLGYPHLPNKYLPPSLPPLCAPGGIYAALVLALLVAVFAVVGVKATQQPAPQAQRQGGRRRRGKGGTAGVAASGAADDADLATPLLAAEVGLGVWDMARFMQYRSLVFCGCCAVLCLALLVNPPCTL